MQRSSFAGWASLCAALRATASVRSVFDRIVKLYSSPPRAYHNLSHVDHCLTEFNPARRLARNPAAVEAALWFHDCVYNSRASDNEERSAAVAVESLGRLGVGAALRDRVSTLILHTKHVSVPDSGDGMIVVDVDLAILGTSPRIFARYEAGVRSEYGWVSGDVFWPKRRDFLQAMLNRDRIYATDFFHAKYETAARENLRRSVAAIDRGRNAVSGSVSS